MTTVIKQFRDLKKRYPKALILLRTSDFYFSFFDDARDASRILGITLTKSSKLTDEEGHMVAQVAFPYHELDIYLPKLIRAGKMVVICDQIEEPKTKRLAKRGINQTLRS